MKALTTSKSAGTDGASAPGPKEALLKAAARTKAPTTKFTSLKNAKGRWVKILGYGHSGTGKSLALVAFLKLGFKVAVISTGLGGDGLASVYNQLEDENLDHLKENLIYADFPNYEALMAFLDDPTTADLSELGFKDIYEFNPDFLVWEELSTYQSDHLDTYVLDMQPLRKENKDNVSELRAAGLQAEQTDWGGIKRGTLRPLNKFLRLHDFTRGKVWHKYVTCHESKPTENVLTKEVRKAPLIQGAAGSLMEGAFDIIIEMRVEKKGDGREYSYRCVGHQGLVAKSRGYKMEATEPADMEKLWREKIAPRLQEKEPANA